MTKVGRTKPGVLNPALKAIFGANVRYILAYVLQNQFY